MLARNMRRAVDWLASAGEGVQRHGAPSIKLVVVRSSLPTLASSVTAAAPCRRCLLRATHSCSCGTFHGAADAPCYQSAPQQYTCAEEC